MEEQRSSSNKLGIVILGCLALLICLCCLCLVLLGGMAFLLEQEPQLLDWLTPLPETAVALVPAPSTPAVSPTTVWRKDDPETPTPTATAVPPTEITPTPTPTPIPTPTAVILPPDQINQQTIPARAHGDLIRLYETDYPYLDYYETAVRLGKKNLGSRTVTGPQFTLGDRHTFITDEGRIETQLVAITDHVYFWVEDSLNLDKGETLRAAEKLENDYYPRLVNLFGQEWQPGIDNDPHFSVVHIEGEWDASELGYFSDVNQYPRTLYSESNEQEAIYMIMGNLELGSDLYYGTLVHELQHLIQWYVDPNEATWLNEGLSQLAEIYVGLHTAKSSYYLDQPEIQLNIWEYEDDVIDAHYSASYLYAVYVWEQLGETAVQELSRHPANGLAAVRSILQGYAPDRSLESFTADWAVANLLDDEAAGTAYHYQHLDLITPNYKFRLTEPGLDTVEQLAQFSTHSLELDFKTTTTITFAGDTTVSLISDPPPSGEQFWFAPAVDDFNAHLTADFDLTNLNSATLRFNAWYDLEEDYDFAYISISTDDGETWDLLVPEHLTAGEYGPAWNGRSATESDHLGGWVKEKINLTPYVGHTVQIRFDVLTDAAIAGYGFAVDEINIPELNYYTDVEGDPAGWRAEGFVQTGWQLPQQWAVRLIHGGPNPEVIDLPLNDLNQGQWTVEIGKGRGILLIMPQTPFVTDAATYWLAISE